MQNFKKNTLEQCVQATLIIFSLMTVNSFSSSSSSSILAEPVNACIIGREVALTPEVRSEVARCLGWEPNAKSGVCLGQYSAIPLPSVASDEIQIMADKSSLYNHGQSILSGQVEIQDATRIVTADTAYIYRDAKTSQVTNIKLVGGVHYSEPGRLIIARSAVIDPRTKASTIQDVVYRFDNPRANAQLPSWGQAQLIERFANKNYSLSRATYSTCAPEDKAWHIEASKINLDTQESVGQAYNARLLVGDLPLFYSPFLTFPISKDRKSGLLIPTLGSSNIGGFDFSLPYYLNLAPNYDATLIPHVYTRRGLMMGGQFRYLTHYSAGEINASYLPHDKAFNHFLTANQYEYPQLIGESSDRWSLNIQSVTQFTPNLRLRLNVQQVSDDYYLQDFSSNLAILTERQLPREAELTLTTEHWIIQSLAQSYQTLQPINESVISNIYQRLPQLRAQGNYNGLWLNSNFTINAEVNHFDWPNKLTINPEGQRYFVNPMLSLPQVKPWGFVTPSLEWVDRYYDLNNYSSIDYSNNYNFLGELSGAPASNYLYNSTKNVYFKDSIPRFSVDSGLYFDREVTLFRQAFTQTLEPRLYYLNVPYHNQTEIPVFDSGYMIFDVDQLFRNNRFSSYDRIGDTNQLSYALTSRWLSAINGVEKANFTIGQIRYFSDRQVQLCQSSAGYCQDNPLTLGYLPLDTRFSPIASRLTYHFNPDWSALANYVWDVEASHTYNSNLNIHYQPRENAIINLGYTYLTNGDVTLVNNILQPDPLHQATVSFAWPVRDSWSVLGAYNYNMSKGYEMLSFLGVQYDSCCWAIRLVGGRSFQSLSSSLHPQYNNNLYLQVQLKGLGSMGNSDPASTIRTYLPNYVDTFHRN